MAALARAGRYAVRSLSGPARGVARFSQGSGEAPGDGKSGGLGLNLQELDEEQKELLRKKLLYRSRQRGILELDLIVGAWTRDNVASLDAEGLGALVQVMDEETPDLWSWVSGQYPAPEHLAQNPVFRALNQQVTGNLQAHAPEETRASPGQPWVRGWDDFRKQGGPPAGNQ